MTDKGTPPGAQGELFTYQGVRFVGAPTPKCCVGGCVAEGTRTSVFKRLNPETMSWETVEFHYCEEHPWPAGSLLSSGDANVLRVILTRG